MCIESVADACTKFLLIGHIIQGGSSIGKSAQKTFDLMMKRVGKSVFVNELTSQILSVSGTLIAVLFSFAGWAWFDAAEDHPDAWLKHLD